MFVCQSHHTLKKNVCGCWVSFQFWFGVGGMCIVVWIVICYLGGLLFYNFFGWGVGMVFFWDKFLNLF